MLKSNAIKSIRWTAIVTIDDLATAICRLDSVLSERHPSFHSSLVDGRDSDRMAPRQIDLWFAWRNGQKPESSETLIGNYRLVSLEEADAIVRAARRAALTNPLQGFALLILAPKLLYSQPLLVDESGDGYYHNMITRCVFSRFEGERDTSFGRLKDFVEFMIELLDTEPMSEATWIDRELRLIAKYAN